MTSEVDKNSGILKVDQATRSVQCSKSSGDKPCVDYFKDPGACCMQMILRNIPTEPSDKEKYALIMIQQNNMPLYENSPEFVCYDSANIASIKKAVNQNDEWYLIGQSESLMHYKIFCSMATGKAVLQMALLAVAILSSIY